MSLHPFWFLFLWIWICCLLNNERCFPNMCLFGFLTNVSVWRSLLPVELLEKAKPELFVLMVLLGAYRQERILVFAGFRLYPMSTIVTWGRWQYWCYCILFHFLAVHEFLFWGQQRGGTVFVGFSYFYSVGRERKSCQATLHKPRGISSSIL